jgi:BON domain
VQGLAEIYPQHRAGNLSLHELTDRCHAAYDRSECSEFLNHEAIEKEIDMTNRRPIQALTFAFILTGALAGCATFGECHSDSCRNDAKITSEVRATIDRHPELGDVDLIQVQTSNGVVYLNGQLDDVARSDAGSLARKVPGVDSVVNSIGANP